jgi:hypothetical protein
MWVVEGEAEFVEFGLIQFEDLFVRQLAVVFLGEAVVNAVVHLVAHFAFFFPRQLSFFFRTRSGSLGAHRVHDRAAVAPRRRIMID